MKKGKTFKCSNCPKETYVQPCFLKFKEHFCSRKCQTEFQKRNSFHFDCIICGKVVYTQPAQIKYRNRKTCSIQCRAKLQTKLAEERRLTGKLTKHQIDRAERYSKKAEIWRKSVFARDNYTCQKCGLRGTYLEAHHIQPFAYFQELRYEISNGVTLCKKCHAGTKTNAVLMRKKYGKK